MLRAAPPLPVVCLATNKIAPAYAGLELGIGDSIMIKAVAETCGRSVDAIKAQLEQEGDLGVVALSSRGKQVTLSKPKPLTAPAKGPAKKQVTLLLKEPLDLQGVDWQGCLPGMPVAPLDLPQHWETPRTKLTSQTSSRVLCQLCWHALLCFPT